MTTLYQHVKHPHRPQNANITHWAEQHLAGFNTQLAVGITKATGTMWAAYAFALLALAGFPALASVLGPVIAIYVIWTSQTFIQLTMLPILSVGQQVLGRHAELMADEQFQTTKRSYHDIEQIMKHLEAQDEELLKQTELLVQLLEAKIQS